MNRLLDYILASLRRASENSYAWSVTPTEAGALVTEVERLRKENGSRPPTPAHIDAIRQRHLRPEQMEHRTFYEGHIVIDLATLCDEVEDLRKMVSGLETAAHEERAAVVKFVRGARLDDFADAIERGAHREEKK